MALSMMLALTIGNYGTIVRLRVQVLILLVPFMALGLAARREARAPAVPISPSQVAGPMGAMPAAPGFSQ
jgi:hypothetical protein